MSTTDTLEQHDSHHTLHIELSPANSERLITLCGHLDRHLSQIEQALHVSLNNHGHHFYIKGKAKPAQQTANLLNTLYAMTESQVIQAEDIHLLLQEMEQIDESSDDSFPEVKIKTRRKVIRGRGANQSKYIKGVQSHDLTFGIGPAGTGKTYLAVACAVEALERDLVRRIILVRPAVEAGERLGFLPGDLSQKIDPYLRPMYDALYELMGIEKVNKLIERNVIEVAPLAYMRGRTLNDSFIIMDEAQNTTIEQMKMFLTRLGFNSTAVVTGDITQIDLPSKQTSGLKHVQHILKEVKGISFNYFYAKDVVRHELVKRIVLAYDQSEEQQKTHDDTP